MKKLLIDLPTPSCHASTVVRTPSGYTVAWFGGTRSRRQHGLQIPGLIFFQAFAAQVPGGGFPVDHRRHQHLRRPLAAFFTKHGFPPVPRLSYHSMRPPGRMHSGKIIRYPPPASAASR